MLHNINPSNCERQMDWIVGLQRRILTALCHPKMTKRQVTFEWVVKLLQDEQDDKYVYLNDEWIKQFCTLSVEISGKNQPMLKNMHVLAGIDPVLKQQLIEAFDNDLLFTQNFITQLPQKYKFIGIDKQPEQIKNAVRGFFEIFYKQFFEKSGYGYRIPRTNIRRYERFDKNKFHNYFEENNAHFNIKEVCPVCDGTITNRSRQIDHFYPRSKFPFLSCVVSNLVPICSECNGKKSDKVPLTQGTVDEIVDWFHPYLRSIHGTYELKPIHTEKGVTFALCSNDPQQQKRLDNYQQIFGLQERWRRALPNKISSIIAFTTEDLRQQNSNMDEDELVKEILAGTRTIKHKRGKESFATIEYAYLESLLVKDPLTFDEIWIAYKGADPVTGAEF